MDKQLVDKSKNLLLIGSDVTIRNIPIKEVSLLKEGSLPAYGYNPGDFIELLAGKVSVDKGRLDQCLIWLSSFLTSLDLTPGIRTWSYGEPKEIYQFFRKRNYEDDISRGWFMVHQLLPAEGRSEKGDVIVINDKNREIFNDNCGIIVIDDSGRPPCIARELKEFNPGAWVIALGIGMAHWQKWAAEFGDDFYLFCRLSDLETTRMEMDASVSWETIVAMSLRALRTAEVGLWDDKLSRFCCHIIVEMYPHGILYIGPDNIYFRHRRESLPEKSSPRQKGSVPCYDTLVTSMLAMDCLIAGEPLSFCRGYFFDFSKRVLENWNFLHKNGYSFDNGLEFPNFDFSAAFPDGNPCSSLESDVAPCFIELPPFTSEFSKTLELVSSQIWDKAKKSAMRSFFPIPKSRMDSKGHHPYENIYDVITDILNHLKEEVSRKNGFNQLRIFNIGNLRMTDPVEIDPVMTLQNVMDSYVTREIFKRPLCIGVFGPPGSGKSFAVKEVARVISKKFSGNPFEFFEFNMTQFDRPEEINAAIEPIRASVAKGKVPIVFWDEFDCRYDKHEFGYLRYFLPSMQDGVTYVHGVPYYIGRAIFVFAGGVKSSWEGMEELLKKDNTSFELTKTLKIPDFMSRLRVVLDIDGIEIADSLLADSADTYQLYELRRILLKRAFIIAHQMDTHWKKAARKTSGLLLRLLLAEYKFGARSIEAVIEASGAADRLVYGLPELIAPAAARIHAVWRVELERKVDKLRKEKGMRAVW